MAIIDLQRRLAEAGRIRIGQQVQAANGKSRPAKLETFRLTSPDKLRIEQAAGLYGGRPATWQAPAGQQWEVITTTTAIDVIVPPSDMAFSQWFELWSAGGCQRRCDGRTESISEGPCLCDPENRECDIHTRLSVMLRDLPGLGVWRIDTQGYYAAVELQGAVEVIQIAAGRGQMLPARLLLVQRQVKRPGPDGKPQTRKFAVPVLDIDVTPGQLMAPAGARPELTAGNGHEPVDGSAPLTRVPDTVPARPAGTVAQQMRQAAEPAAPPRRANAAQPVPPTGLQPRTVTEARDQAGDEPGPTAPANGARTPAPLGSASATAAPSEPAADADPDADPGTDPGTITPAQMRKLHAGFTGMGYDSRKEREQLLVTCEIIAGRKLTGPHTAQDGRAETTKNLSRDEAGRLIETLERAGTRDRLTEMLGRMDPPARTAQGDDG